MNKLPFVFCFLLLTLLSHAAPREEWFRNFSLENAVATSDLILAAQVTDVTEIKLLRGGKGESSMYQYKFKPVRVLKGVFARDELSMGSGDLGLYRMEQMKAIKQGAFLLIFLGRSDIGYRNSNNIDSIGQSMPALADARDPLLDAVGTLLAVNAETDRTRRVSLLVEGLKKTSGPGAVALLRSLDRRPLIAAQDAGVVEAVTKHLLDTSPAVREAAARTLSAILEADYLEQAPLRDTAVASSVAALKLADPNSLARYALLRTLGAAGAATLRSEDAMRQLVPPQGANGVVNNHESAARYRSLGDLKAGAAGAVIEAGLAPVSLDDQSIYSKAVEFAIARLTPDKAAAAIQSRLSSKLAAGFDVELEIESFAALSPEGALPALLEISRLPLNATEKSGLAETCRKLAEQKPDPRFVDLLAGLLSPDEPSREPAVSALLKIGSAEAAKALQPHLREEQNLSRKLQIAALLGRHGIRDGYVFAIEHLSEGWVMETAVEALAAIKEPQATLRLREILETSNDIGWNTAAIRGLGAMGAQDMAPKFLTFTADLRNPLAPAALIALADLGEIKALEKAREGLGSRNDRIVTASARVAGILLARPGIADGDLRGKLAALLGDPDADVASRIAALDALLAAKDERLDPVLKTIVREVALENSDLLVRVEKLVRDRKLKL
jgi:hypothetical protein